MMKRLLFVCVILGVLVSLGIYVIQEHKKAANELSLESAFTLFGKPFKALDRSMTKMMNVTDQEEAAYGLKIAHYWAQHSLKSHKKDHQYLSKLLDLMAHQSNPKKLNWKIYLIEGPPNAFAMPGGVIVMTLGLLTILENEAEVVSILAHEKGHVDLGHCMDSMRVVIKTHGNGIDSLMTLFLKGLWHHNFSKYQETEADQYGFDTLIALGYDPQAQASALKKMQTWHQKHGIQDFKHKGIGEYFTTHPALHVRIENATEKAKRWQALHPKSVLYLGKANYLNKVTKNEHHYEE